LDPATVLEMMRLAQGQGGRAEQPAQRQMTQEEADSKLMKEVDAILKR
jgi:hypothetical protein